MTHLNSTIDKGKYLIKTRKMLTDKPQIFMFTPLRGVNAVLTPSSSLFRRYASEQGAGPVTVNLTSKLRLLVRFTVPVSTALGSMSINKDRSRQ